ncbi:peptide/nickel transport system permease protein [Pseudosulfitobacter pseudonitzschiae]|uniref:ABC transporter permease n=1 Tax=Pseudosulfitobacter pseudonitzschiae TaxID=1402135 RepID=A0A073IYF4_9RHOB|nr:ABC transporter permease [Pseudosulfitobacter pseudonitzschiae]KEJ94640.1 ABC transporter permease [Pseudosulfitobacter pseudonitzschiae]QKS10778.1 ABC transporter permease [Pseudosulfitobacter pseudonitzschiae]SHG16235.1 peptide/nickel transport system permease protein [Pseudosulfitobacter pseudonitzschiae]
MRNSVFAPPVTRWQRIRQSDLMLSFLESPVTVIAAVGALLMIFAALGAGVIAFHDPYDMASIDIFDSNLPPAWVEGGDARYPLGTDAVGRGIFSTILYGSRMSIFIGVTSVALSLVIGVTAGLIAGYRGGFMDAVIMRIAEVQLALPTILVALLISGILRAIAPPSTMDKVAILVLILSIGLSNWVQFARAVRASTMVERSQEYVLAARLIGIGPLTIMFRHILPNVMGPIMVIATLNLSGAILTEATLSFLGVGVPPTQPSLGTLINGGTDYLFSGSWWITIFPGAALALLVLTVNLVGDWLRDALNPTLG